MIVPNHSQVDRIATDLRKLAHNDDPAVWQGNSYQGFPVTAKVRQETKHNGYQLKHWSTTIAEFHYTPQGVVLAYFDARYISSTTRGFQGRILRAMSRVFGPAHATVVRVAEELALPTGERGVLDWCE